MRFDLCSDGSQNGIPRQMSKSIVDGLEIINIDEREREGPFIAIVSSGWVA